MQVGLVAVCQVTLDIYSNQARALAECEVTRQRDGLDHTPAIGH